MALTAKKALGAAKKYTDEAIAGGGGGGTRDYEQLTNLPTINSVELKGNRDLAPLVNGKVPAANLPSYVDDVVEGYLYEGHFYEDSQHTTEITGEIGKIYVDLTASVSYRWSGSAFVRVDDVDLSNYYNKTDSDTHYLKKDGASGNYQTVNGSVSVQGEVWAKDNIALSNVAESLAYFNSGTKADKLYNIGDRFVYQGMLLEAIQTINGNSDIVITEGVTQNAEKVTLDEVIEDVASDIPDVSGKTDLTIIAGVEASTTASKAYALNDRLIYNGKLYKATAAIAQGDTIVTSGAGQNVTETTVDAEITSSSPSGKADKVANATSGNFAGLDANGNLTDSGKKANDFTGKSFDGTSEEWAALSAAQRAEYAAGLVIIKNDTTNAMLVDSTPTENSNNLVKSGGVYAHRVVAGKQADTTLGLCATAEGLNNQASGDFCHVEGRLNLASGQASHAEGYTSIARGDYSHAGGYWNLAQKKGQTVIGRLNEYEEYTESTDYGVYAFIIGNGTSNNARHNAFAVKWDGTHEINGNVIIGQHYDSAQSQNVGSNLTVSGAVNANGSDYAEKFESAEECPVGRFVTLDGERIRLAQPGDDYILGVTSENPAIIGDKDNPGTPVGLVGKLWVEHDGTAKVNGFAVSGADGIATDGGSTGYRVMAIEGNRVKVLVK